MLGEKGEKQHFGKISGSNLENLLSLLQENNK